MQSFDFTTLTAVCSQLCLNWVPARLEQVYQRDRFSLALGLRTAKQRGWLNISWHPVAAHLCLGDPPPRVRDTFTFSDQLRHQLQRLTLIAIETVAPLERVLDFQFAQRPLEKPLWHLYVEIMGKYSNVILTDSDLQIVTVAHQVSASQSSVRTLQTGQAYQLPPALTSTMPSLAELMASWQARVSLIPGAIERQLIKCYRGLSPSLVRSMLLEANLDPKQSTTTLRVDDWLKLYQLWQEWLQAIFYSKFSYGWTKDGYTVMGWGMTQPVFDLHSLINSYYTQQLNQESFIQLRHQLQQKVKSLLVKLRLKVDSYKQRLAQSAQADLYRYQADLLMSYLHLWQPGMKSITLSDFETNQPVTIPLNPEKNAVQNTQALYKLHQKLKRAQKAVQPLLNEVLAEIAYLEQIDASLAQLDQYQTPDDLETLREIREELIQQNYLEAQDRNRSPAEEEIKPLRYQTPSGFELWIGRNNRQNDQLSFRLANNYDLWFHTQEIPGSHVLLRLDPGAVPDPMDLQFAADLASYYSRARESEQVSVVYTTPKYLYKPKGAKPGMAVYKQEKTIWGRPQNAKDYLESKSVSTKLTFREEGKGKREKE